MGRNGTLRDRKISELDISRRGVGNIVDAKGQKRGILSGEGIARFHEGLKSEEM